MPATATSPATSSTSRATPRPASMRAPFWKAACREEQLQEFPPRTARRARALPSYPHPWLMPDFWRFPTVSMGHRPAECDLPGALHALPGEPRPHPDHTDARSGRSSATAKPTSPNPWARSRWASREKLDNLIFVVNCNLQRLDGPVRGNGKIINELEAAFRGAGWNVIKVMWGADWDKLFARDNTGLLLKRMEEVVDGELPELQGQGRRVHPQGVLRQVSRAARDWSRT